MLPETVLASISALASDGIVNDSDPFTEFRSTDCPASWSNFASSRPFTVESSARPDRLWACSLPLMHDALTSPVIPVMSSAPLISLISSNLAVRGTVSVYSTLAGLLREPQFQLLLWSGYFVRIDR